MNTYEKKYKEIVGQIKKAYLYAQADSTKAILKEIFPELKESEDEKVRKDIISYIQVANQVIPQFQKDKWIAWLEKQGEKKPQRMISAEAKEAMYDKPAWSEEDKEKLGNAIYACLHIYGKDSDTADWLKSLRKRIEGE